MLRSGVILQHLAITADLAAYISIHAAQASDGRSNSHNKLIEFTGVKRFERATQWLLQLRRVCTISHRQLTINQCQWKLFPVMTPVVHLEPHQIDALIYAGA